MGFWTHVLSVLVIFVAIFMTIFTNYPSPPPSPILYQWRDYGSTFKHKEYDIFYIDEVMDENSTKPALLCLHGFPTSSFDYYKMLPDLRRKFDRILFVDFLGFGFSSKPRFHIYSIFEQALIVEKLLAQVKVDKVHLLTHDYGDTVAQELIARQNEGKLPFQIETATLMNGGVFPEVYRPLFIMRMLRFPIIGTILGRFHNYLTFRHFLTGVFGERSQPTVAELHDIWSVVRHNDGFRVFSHLLNYLEERQSFQDRWVGALRQTSVPLQMIYGPADPINPSDLFVPYFEKHLPHQRIDVLDALVGHYPNLEAPKPVLDLLLDFLEQKRFYKK